MLVKALTTASCGHLIIVRPQDLLNNLIGGTEKQTSAIFEIAQAKSEESQHPTVLFFDEIDGILGKPGHNDSKAEINIIKIMVHKRQGFIKWLKKEEKVN